MADLIISQPMTFTVDVKNGLVERPQRESLMRGDKMANRIIAELMYGSEPFDITDVTVKGKFCRPPSGDEIDLPGEAKGNVAEVQLTDQCYTSGGHYEARVILVLGGVERTVLFISGDVLKSGSGNAAGDEETGGSGGSTGSGLPAGGTAGQVLVKVSSAQGDAIWKTMTAADVGARPDNWMPTAADVGALGKNETAVNATQLNGKDAVHYLGARNLMDNSDFGIAQAGYNAYHGSALFVADRWIASNISISVEGELKTLTANGNYCFIQQNMWNDGRDNGKTYTASIEVEDGTIYTVTARVPSAGVTADTSLSSVGVEGKATLAVYKGASGILFARLIMSGSGTTFTFKRIYLYEGEYTADNLPPYVAPDPVLELAKCQAYCVDCSNGRPNDWSTGFVTDSGYVMIPLHTPVPMRKGVVPSPVNLSSMQLYTGSAWVSWPGVSPTLQYANNTLTLQGHISNFASAGVTLTAGQIFMIKNLPLLSSDL